MYREQWKFHLANSKKLEHMVTLFIGTSPKSVWICEMLRPLNVQSSYQLLSSSNGNNFQPNPMRLFHLSPRLDWWVVVLTGPKTTPSTTVLSQGPPSLLCVTHSKFAVEFTLCLKWENGAPSTRARVHHPFHHSFHPHGALQRPEPESLAHRESPFTRIYWRLLR